MSARRSRKTARLASQTAELALVAPQVIAHRVGRMIAAGHQPTPRDRAEFNRMGSEKFAAFTTAWIAMGLRAWQLQQQIGLALLRSWWTPWAWSRPGASPLPGLLSGGVLSIAGKGIAPLHATASANLRRLSRRR
ncbi:polyhydroxyalkanoate granule-associated phasin [Roseateles violae]|uniref:Uncharacterized protein n=1 Tax=Roseateles violae TaxID=3058042 RepID=A0ABT8DXS8_9BURK|nr:polyhydroxyalkanoate granule-associated phasin [Pelomonas sp. PFR6]MDN3922438.1 hypothetical protein [Pelomonas sp. PFR6]